MHFKLQPAGDAWGKRGSISLGGYSRKNNRPMASRVKLNCGRIHSIWQLVADQSRSTGIPTGGFQKSPNKG